MRIFHKIATIIMVGICYIVGLLAAISFLEPLLQEYGTVDGEILFVFFACVIMFGSAITALVFS